MEMLPTWLHKQIFKNRPSPPREIQKIAVEHLVRQGIFKTDSNGVPLPSPLTTQQSLTNEFTLPSLNGDTIAEHFWRIGENQARPVRELARKFASVSLPNIPAPGAWVFKSGWTRYGKDNSPEPVAFPNEEVLCFDVETLVPDCPFSVLATAASPTAWYSWVSPRLIKHKENREKGIENYEPTVKGHLIPIGTLNRERIIVGHNIGYDRARIKEEYHFKPSGTSFLDTMALHIAVNGVSGVPNWARAKWEANSTEMKNIYGVYDVTFVSGLNRVYEYHFKKQLDKSTRNIFVDGTMEEIVEPETFQKLMTYCAKDVEATHQVYQKVFPRFLKICPHPVSFAGMLHMGNMFLTTTRQDWNEYIESSDTIYAERSCKLDHVLQNLAREAVQLSPEIIRNDHWLKQLDWSIATNGKKLAGYPTWYRELWDSKTEQLKISPSSKIGIMLMKLTWKGFPIYYSKRFGYVYRVPIQDNSFTPTSITTPLCIFSVNDEDYDLFAGDIGGCYYQISKTLLLKNFYEKIEKGTIKSEYEYVTTELLNQVFLLSIGTLMRRAIDRDWFTTETLNENYVGANYREKIKAPKGHKIVCGKLESLELWIASLIGDSQFGFHGATAMSWHVLQGDSLLGTDMHSRTARELNVSRNQARLIDYGRIFGGNRTFGGNFMFVNEMLERLQSSENSSNGNDLDTINKAIRFYKKTEGSIFFKNKTKYFWYGGSESYTVNAFDDIDYNSYTNDIRSKNSRTPILKSGKPWGLQLIDKPVNWVVQSAAVDFQHLLLVSMQYLIDKYQINARLMLMDYDTVQFLCDEEECYRVALAMQTSHLWTRSLFSYMMGIEDLPLSLAFFPSIEIRNQLDQKNNSKPISRITMMDILELLNKKENSKETTKNISLTAFEKLLIKPLAESNEKNNLLTSSIMIPQEVESLLNPYCPPEDSILFLELQSLTTEEEIQALFRMRRMDGLAKMYDYIKRTYPRFFGKVERYFKLAV
ncbi:12075_t:CDS:2 [Ambispora leptoticha]|uniref:Mitochondrial DNA polymerase catalytic subunit n=1 Tax=Ambispora leptoticha TaxID=144679 RepID=A0A9N8Z4U4_9GLOM|nr:12075_t:CDS:2 [Ambispora leptoticha]